MFTLSDSGRFGVAAAVLIAILGSMVLVRGDTPAVARPDPGGVSRIAWLDHVDALSSRTPTKWGMHLLLDDGEVQWPVDVWDQHLAATRALVGPGGYVLQLTRLGDLDVAKWQHYIDRAVAHDLKPMLRLASFSNPRLGRWEAPPKDANGRTYRGVAQEFARFVGALQSPGVLYVTVGNEPNRGDEWGGSPNPAEYARFLLDVSEALHEIGRGRILVLNGALDQYAPHTQGVAINGFEAIDALSFLDAMHAAVPEVWEHIDLWAAHSYPMGPFEAHPRHTEFRVDDVYRAEPLREPPVPGLKNRGINSYRAELFRLRQLGVHRFERVFITESGWRHRDTQRPSVDSIGATIPAREAADNLIAAFYGDGAWNRLAPESWTPWLWDPDVQGVVLFALAGEPTKWGHTNYLDLGERGQVLGLKPGFAGLRK